MKVVKVYGALKERLGQSRFEFDVATPAEALRALFVNFPGLEKWIIDNDQDGIGYKVKVGKEQVMEDNLEDLYYPWSERDVFSITPILTGSGRGFGKFILGAVLIAAAGLTGGATIGTFGITGAIKVSKIIKTVGVMMALQGAAEMISPMPDMPDLKEANRLKNFSFSGVINTSQIGTPVPIAYGRLFVGSSVISSGLDVDQVI